MIIPMMNASISPEMREAHHRVMNTLAILHALLRKGFSRFSDQHVRDAVTQFEARIIALRDLHLTIAIGAGDGVASVDRYIGQLCESLCEGLLSPRGIQCEVRVEPGYLSSQVCERLGLIIVELVTNSMKHAFPDRDGGLVRIEMTREGDFWLLTVSDDGVGFRDQRSGTGLEMVHLLARSAGADVTFAPQCEGVTVAISVPSIEFNVSLSRLEKDFPGMQTPEQNNQE